MKHRIVMFGLWLSLGAGTWSAASAEDTTVDISVGDWPPFVAESLPHNGFIAHLISDVFAAAGYQVEFHFRPWNRTYYEAATGQRDATAVWMFEPERAEDFYYSDPVLKERFVFFYLKDRSFDWDTLDDLAGKHLGGSLAYSYGPAFDAALERDVFKLHRVATNRQNFARLLLGRIDVVPEEISVGYHSLRRDLSPEQANRITHHPKPFLENDSFVLFPRVSSRSQKLLKIFNETLEKFRSSGRYQTYFDQFDAGEYDSTESKSERQSD